MAHRFADAAAAAARGGPRALACRASRGRDAAPAPAPWTPAGALQAWRRSDKRPPEKPSRSDADTYRRLMDQTDDEGDESLGEADAVCKLFVSHTEPNASLPWSRRRQYASTSSAFIVSRRRLLSNAHSVEHSTSISVSKRGDDAKYSARVLAVGAECDISLLAVDDEAFWADAPEPLQFGTLPRLQAEVSVIGYPVGGDSVSVTQGVVSRIEVSSYAHGATELLSIQIDAAINAGNSGGPVLNAAGECVGVAFQSLKDGDSEGVGYVIPTPVVAHFLADVERNGVHTGFPTAGFEWQELESSALRAFLGLKKGAKGVLVTRVEPTSPCSSFLRRGDVVTAFDGVALSSDGTVPFRTGERISFAHLIAQRFVGDTARLDIIRDGQPMGGDVVLGVPTLLVPLRSATPPSYLILGGLVLVPATEDYLRAEFGEDYEFASPLPLLQCMFREMAPTRHAQVVVLSQILAHEVNAGFADASFATQVVTSFNGAPVSSLAALAQAAAACDDAFWRFELGDGDLCVLHAAEARAAAPAILATHGVPAQASADILSFLERSNGAG